MDSNITDAELAWFTPQQSPLILRQDTHGDQELSAGRCVHLVQALR